MNEDSPPNSFWRWFWVAYLPPFVLGAGTMLLVAGWLRGPARMLLLPLAAWSLLSSKLMALRGERRGWTRGHFYAWGAGLSTSLFSGLSLMWSGAESLAGDFGFGLFVAGAFLLALTIAAPIFKGLDLGVTFAARGLLRATAGSPRSHPALFEPAPTMTIPAEDTHQRRGA